MTGKKSRWGTLYGLGLGPGDPELITLKAQRILRSVATLLVPVRQANDPGYAWAIAEPHLVSSRQRVLRLPFPSECDQLELDAQWDRHCEHILSAMDDGHDAAFLTEGDPLLYGSFIHVVARLRASAPELGVQIVPGVSSISAAAAAAGEPLATRAERLAVVPAVYSVEELRPIMQDFETVVLVKVNRVLDRIIPLLNELGLAEHALLVERCGYSDERIVRGLKEWTPAPIDYFSLVIVKK